MSQQINRAEISTLPPEMIAKIFEFLTYSERLTTSRTCKAWHQLAFSGKFGKNVNIGINSSSLDVVRNTQDKWKFRNASLIINSFFRNQSVAIDFIKSASIESLKFRCDSKECIKTILECANVLTKLHLRIQAPEREPDKDVLKLNHPTVRSILIDDLTYRESFEINCPNLIDLTMQLTNENSVHVVAQLQHQLQSLELECYKKLYTDMLANAELSNLKKLCLKMNEGAELSFERMANLEELQLYKFSYKAITVGEQLYVLTSLSKLILSQITIDTRAFAKALSKMVGLKDLGLFHCKFTPSIQSCPITSNSIRNLELISLSPVVLPNFAKLKRLSFTNFNHEDEGIDDPFELACSVYPELEELRFEVQNPPIRKFRLQYIKKLKLLKDLQLVRLYTDTIDWTACHDMKKIKLQLDSCRIRGTVALQLVQSIGHGLSQLYLDQCYLSPPRLDVFDVIDGESSAEGLRKSLPWCSVSYKDCYVMDEDSFGK